jgi:hypothetical protein
MMMMRRKKSRRRRRYDCGCDNEVDGGDGKRIIVKRRRGDDYLR